MKFTTLVLPALLLTASAVPALAHHSFAMFDQNKTTTVAGTMKEFEWINPHVWIHLTSTDQAGKPATWTFEAGSTGQLTASGWKNDTLKPGDKIEMTFHPLKDGSHGGQVLSVKMPDGKTLCQGADCRRNAGVEYRGGD